MDVNPLLVVCCSDLIYIHRKKNSKVKTHYGDPLWGVTLHYFSHVCMFEVYPTLNFQKNFTIFLHIMLKYNLGKY